MIKYDYSKLYGKIREKGMTQAQLAQEIGINQATLNKTLKNKRYFEQREIDTIRHVLDLPNVEEYFFAAKRT